MGRPLLVVCSLAGFVLPLSLALAGCSQNLSVTPSAPSGRTNPSETTTPPPAPTSDDPQRLVARGMVRDDGDGPGWCLGAIAESYPPQCTGIPLKGWTWPAGAETSNGVTWADYALVGTYDQATFTVEKVITEAEAAEALPEPEAPATFDSPCSEPAGGWTSPDPERATAEAQKRAFETAAGVGGYAGSWIDDRGDLAQDPLTSVVNVQVTGDVVAAERELRRVWGGPLCISQVSHTEAELTEMVERLTERSDLQLAGIESNHVELSVTYDDGTLQRELDTTYGEGLVRVNSVLQPYSG